MERVFNPVLTEEQLAAYLDGFLTEEESLEIEELIALDPDLEEIQDAIDQVDAIYIDNYDAEIPLECMADDFTLPSMDYTSDYDSTFYAGEDEYHEEHAEDFMTDDQDDFDDSCSEEDLACDFDDVVF